MYNLVPGLALFSVSLPVGNLWAPHCSSQSCDGTDCCSSSKPPGESDRDGAEWVGLASPCLPIQPACSAWPVLPTSSEEIVTEEVHDKGALNTLT